VAYVDGEPVASVTWQETPDKILLGSAYTRPDQRGKGLFTALTKDLRSRGKPVDAVVWDNPWLREKVASWANAAGMSSPPGEMSSTLAHRAKTAPEVSSQPPHDISGDSELSAATAKDWAFADDDHRASEHEGVIPARPEYVRDLSTGEIGALRHYTAGAPTRAE